VNRHALLVLVLVLAELASCIPGQFFSASSAHAQQNAVGLVVINEIHYNPDLSTDWLEYVELHNVSDQPVNMSRWVLAGGVRFGFPANLAIPPRGFIVVGEHPASLKARFGVSAYGPFEGRLSNGSDRIELRDERSIIVDEVKYESGFPWPSVGYAPGNSIQLLNPTFDNSKAGNWRSGSPTPGRQNAAVIANAGPLIDSVEHTPTSPKPGQAVAVTVNVADSDGVAAVNLRYQVVSPGAYIRLTDPAYAANWTTIAMSRAANGSYQAQIPAGVQQNRTLIRYRVEAADSRGIKVVVPYPDDQQPNFAYFVYDTVPQWPASHPTQGAATFDFTLMRPVPVYHFIAQQSDVADAMFMPDSPNPAGYYGKEYLWRGTLVYGDEVYDHVGFRARGAQTRFATGKTRWKINFNPGHRFQAYDDNGQPYEEKWDKLNLNSTLQQSHRDRRGEQGMFESTTFRLFNLAGVAAPNTNFVHWRVIDCAAVDCGGQFSTDFWGLYIAIEQPDGRFLDEHDLPDGNLYNMEDWVPDRQNLGRNGPTDFSDVNAFLNAIRHNVPDAAWWRTNFDLEAYYSFRATLEFTHHYDVNLGKNYMYYLNPETRKWSVLPWDVDLTWSKQMPGTGVDEFVERVLTIPDFNVEYQNRVRELRDLLFNQEQIFAMLDEHANRIDTPAGRNSMVAADRYMWDYNPIYQAINPTTNLPYVDPDRTAPGEFYQSPQYASPPLPTTFRGMVDEMKRYALERFIWMDAYLLTDRDFPSTPTIAYSGQAGFPVDRLKFTAGPFNDPQGAGTFAAVEWRVSEVARPGEPWRFESEAVWESGPVGSLVREWSPPAGVTEAGHRYRTRVRYKDSSGRWSHWSGPVEFTTTGPVSTKETHLKISEIMYHPLPGENAPEDDLEFVELQNVGTSIIDLSYVRLRGGISYQFPLGSQLEPGRYAVIAENSGAYARRYRKAPDGQYSGQLGNSSDTVEIIDSSNRSLFLVRYGNAAPWPTEANGQGHSLIYSKLTCQDAAACNPSNPADWRKSFAINGSPGATEPQRVVINEVRLLPTDARSVELHNTGDVPADVGRWFLSDSVREPRKVQLPPGSVIPPGGYLVVPANVLANGSYDGNLNIDPSKRTELVLSAAGADDWPSGYTHRVDFGPLEAGVSAGSILDSEGDEHFVALAQSSPGAANAGAQVGPVVISEINYDPATGDEYVELLNISSAPVQLGDNLNSLGEWQLEGAYFSFPAGVELPPGGRVLLTPQSPALACRQYAGRGYVRILGPAVGSLSDTSQPIRLLKPVALVGRLTHVESESVTYSSTAPWPDEAAGKGAAIGRIQPGKFGDDPSNWQAVSPPPGIDVAPTGALCAFSALPNDKGQGVSVEWALDGGAQPAGFKLWRNSVPLRNGQEVEVPLSGLVVSAGGDAIAIYTVTDPAANSSQKAFYWLEASSGADTRELGMTSIQRVPSQVFLPAVFR
jgi:hypothetical protein